MGVAGCCEWTLLTAVSLLELGLVREVRHGVQLHLGCISKEFVVDALLKGGC